MRRLLVIGASAAMLAASAAYAGEVKGPPGDPDDPVHNTNRTGAPEHANSNCAYSGLNDFDGAEGQQVSQVQTAADSWKFYELPKGSPGTLGLCKGGTNADRGGEE